MEETASQKVENIFCFYFKGHLFPFPFSENPSEHFTANLVPDYGNPKRVSFGNLAKRNFPDSCKNKRIWMHFRGSIDPFPDSGILRGLRNP
ncbi:hypothetical protein CEXT_241551 [Caerostris extrusa]|uniref:Uncharacterized protein n=1 Tax=Caerostris extrusa TaxID=172846 RepID=A0AAV4UAP4_CAEEX|nr:hypothetical protein CEXT_241551 [Caerostris extrusa]